MDVGVHYYRYFTDTDRKHLIQYALDPEAYARLQDDPEVSDPLTATNERAAQYATQALDHSACGLVTWRKPLGGAEVGYAETPSGSGRRPVHCYPAAGLRPRPTMVLLYAYKTCRLI